MKLNADSHGLAMWGSCIDDYLFLFTGDDPLEKGRLRGLNGYLDDDTRDDSL